jgi:hypothetical protein
MSVIANRDKHIQSYSILKIAFVRQRSENIINENFDGLILKVKRCPNRFP